MLIIQKVCSLLTLVYVFVTLFIANSMQLTYLSCDGLPTPTNVKIQGCAILPCKLQRGTSVEANIDFDVLENSKSLRPVVDIELGNVHMDYPFPEQNACKNLATGQCPLEKGEPVSYYLKMPIEKSYPRISLTIQFSLVDEHNKSQVCIRIPAKVVD
ncbi:Protein NPC2 like protein [Eufriesea mexicana]|nr:Protein NPC2 like protein [Eufriesea mexicana]